MVSRKQGRLKRKNHAQDCETLSALREQRPAILPWSLCFEWRPSFRWSRATHVSPRDGHLARHRPAAGVLLDVIVRPIPNRTT